MNRVTMFTQKTAEILTSTLVRTELDVIEAQAAVTAAALRNDKEALYKAAVGYGAAEAAAKAAK